MVEIIDDEDDKHNNKEKEMEMKMMNTNASQRFWLKEKMKVTENLDGIQNEEDDLHQISLKKEEGSWDLFGTFMTFIRT